MKKFLMMSGILAIFLSIVTGCVFDNNSTATTDSQIPSEFIVTSEDRGIFPPNPAPRQLYSIEEYESFITSGEYRQYLQNIYGDQLNDVDVIYGKEGFYFLPVVPEAWGKFKLIEFGPGNVSFRYENAEVTHWYKPETDFYADEEVDIVKNAKGKKISIFKDSESWIAIEQGYLISVHFGIENCVTSLKASENIDGVSMEKVYIKK